MGIFMLLVYIGGSEVAENKLGFWRSIIWPYYVGVEIANWAFRDRKDS